MTPTVSELLVYYSTPRSNICIHYRASLCCWIPANSGILMCSAPHQRTSLGNPRPYCSPVKRRTTDMSHGLEGTLLAWSLQIYSLLFFSKEQCLHSMHSRTGCEKLHHWLWKCGAWGQLVFADWLIYTVWNAELYAWNGWSSTNKGGLLGPWYFNRGSSIFSNVYSL